MIWFVHSCFKLVVLWPTAQFQPTFKGHIGALNKLLVQKLSRHFPIIMVNQDYTSKHTHCCQSKAVHGKKTIEYTDKHGQIAKRTINIRGLIYRHDTI